MAAIGRAERVAERQPPPVSLARISLPPLDEAAERVARERIIRDGRDAWAEISRQQSFSGWAKIGAALSVGRQHCLYITDSSAPWHAQRYGAKFSEWCRKFGFSGMPASVRSVAIELSENLTEIERWRSTLDERQRRRLIHPLSNVRRWKAATGKYQMMRIRDVKSAAEYALKRFISCMKMLPPDQAAAMRKKARDAMGSSNETPAETSIAAA